MYIFGDFWIKTDTVFYITVRVSEKVLFATVLSFETRVKFKVSYSEEIKQKLIMLWLRNHT